MADIQSEMPVIVREGSATPYGQHILVGRNLLAADEPKRLGGQETGPSPYELLMSALGACTSMTLRMYANRHGWKLEQISVSLRHVVEATTDGQVDRFQRDITLIGELDAEQRAKLLEIAEKCPVSKTLSRASHVVSAIT